MDIILKIADWTSFFAIIIAFVISIVCWKKDFLYPIQLYIAISFVVNSVLKTIEIFPGNEFALKIASVVVNIYSIVEILIICYFLYLRLTRNVFRITVRFLVVLYWCICLLMWTIYPKSFFVNALPLYGIENLFILTSCIFCMYEILKSDILINLKSDSNFIVICGILFYFSITAPFFIGYFFLIRIAPELDKLLNLLNSIAYTLLFISFMKAYLCQYQEQKQ